MVGSFARRHNHPDGMPLFLMDSSYRTLSRRPGLSLLKCWFNGIRCNEWRQIIDQVRMKYGQKSSTKTLHKLVVTHEGQQFINHRSPNQSPIELLSWSIFRAFISRRITAIDLQPYSNNNRKISQSFSGPCAWNVRHNLNELIHCVKDTWHFIIPMEKLLRFHFTVDSTTVDKSHDTR